jgi:hypothetical protein
VLTVSNPAGNKALATTVSYGGQPAQTATITGGGSKAFTFTLNAAETATIAFADPSRVDIDPRRTTGRQLRPGRPPANSLTGVIASAPGWSPSGPG